MMSVGAAARQTVRCCKRGILTATSHSSSRLHTQRRVLPCIAVRFAPARLHSAQTNAMLVRLSRASTFTAATSASMLMQPRLALPLPNVCGTLVSSRSSCAASGCHPHVLMRWAQAQQQMLGRLSVRMHATKQAGPRSAEVPAPQQPRGSSARMSMRSLGLPSLLVLIPGGLLLLALLTLAAAPAALAADFGAQAALRLLTSSLSGAAPFRPTAASEEKFLSNAR